MHAIEHHGELVRIRLWSRFSRAVGYEVSAFLHRGLLVDTGFPRAVWEMDALLGELRPERVAVTHWHEDHAGNADRAAARGIPVVMSAATEARLQERPTVGLYRRMTWGRNRAWAGAPTERDLAPYTFLPAPGHSADHHVVWDQESGTLFGGDLFIGVKVRVAHPGEDPRALVRTLRQTAALEPALLCDAHRGFVPAPGTLLHAKADWLEETIAAIDARIDDGWTDRAIRRDVLGREESTGWFSFGDYARINLVRCVRRTRAAG